MPSTLSLKGARFALQHMDTHSHQYLIKPKVKLEAGVRWHRRYFLKPSNSKQKYDPKRQQLWHAWHRHCEAWRASSSNDGYGSSFALGVDGECPSYGSTDVSGQG